MKSYFLEGLPDRSAAESALCALLPGQTDPWLLLAGPGDPVAYFHWRSSSDEEELLGPFLVQADVSGRHYDRDDAVLRVLRSIRSEVGGAIRNDDGELLS